VPLSSAVLTIGPLSGWTQPIELRAAYLPLTRLYILFVKLPGGRAPELQPLFWILKNVMEKLSKDESGSSQGIVKRPCEVFDMIGGVRTGGSMV
jgi:hypothetical protein